MTTDKLAALDAKALAILFHETYERLAPSFGYETRDETKQFDPDSPNGRLMVAVCGEIANDLVPRAELDEATMQWANALANLRQGQSDTPRCEPPSDYAVERAFKDIKDVLRARAFLARHTQEADHG